MIVSINNGSVSLGFKNCQKEILKDINLTINKGKFISIIGHSGCGKTTLLRIIAGLQKLSSGNILYNNELIKFGWVPQFPVLLPNKNILENITLPLTINGKKNNKYAKELISKYGLNKFISNYPNQISGGMKQKVSILRSLVTNPELLLMDEPFASIDQYTREILNIDLANKIRSENITTILVTHSIEEAVFLSDEIIILKPKIPSTIHKILKISLPKNRSIEIKNTLQYIKYIAKLRNILFSLSSNYYEKE